MLHAKIFALGPIFTAGFTPPRIRDFLQRHVKHENYAPLLRKFQLKIQIMSDREERDANPKTLYPIVLGFIKARLELNLANLFYYPQSII